MRNFTLLTRFSLLLLLLLSFQAAEAEGRLMFSARLNGAQETPPVVTTAQGVGAFMLNATGDSLCVNVAVTNLSGSIVSAHIHEGAPGVAGNVVIGLSHLVTGTRITGAVPINDAQVRRLMQGMYYINIHTAANVNGEIRGQITLEGGWGYSAWLSDSLTGSGATGYGLGTFTVSRDERYVDVMVVAHELTGPITSASLRGATVGGPTVGLDSLISNDVIAGRVQASQLWLDSLGSNMYIQINTAANPGGELRGNITSNSMGHLAFDGWLDRDYHGTASTAHGVVALRANAPLDSIWYWAAWDTLLGSLTGIHFHDSSGDVVHNLMPNVVNNRAVGLWVNPPDSVRKELLMGKVYLNIHSSIYPSGELGGNVHSVASVGFMVHMDGDQENPPVATAGMGGGFVSVDVRTKTSAHYMFVLDSLTTPITGAHFHKGVVGVNGPVVFPITFVNEFTSGYWDETSSPAFTPDMFDKLALDSIYVNVHTTAHTGGEIRGQVTYTAGCTQLNVGIDDPAGTALHARAYPNPSQGRFAIQVDGHYPKGFRMQVVDAAGRTIVPERKVAAHHSIDLDLTGQATGLYLLRLHSIADGRTTTLRLAVE